MEVLEGKIALVTGSSGGLGSSIAKEMSQRGCIVHVTGRNSDKLAEIEGNGRFAGSHIVDLRNISKLESLIEEVRPEILVNCAGLFPVGGIVESDKEEFDEAFEVNVRAPYFLTKFAITHMEGWGRVVNIGSSSSYSGFAGTSIYCASKHALLGISRSLFHELKDSGIRVFCVSPGSIKTEMGLKVKGQDYETFIEPEDIAKLICDTIGQDGNMITEEIRINRMYIQ